MKALEGGFMDVLWDLYLVIASAMAIQPTKHPARSWNTPRIVRRPRGVKVRKQLSGTPGEPTDRFGGLC